MKLTIGDRTYLISFRHKTQLGKRPKLHRRSPVKAITMCVVTVQKPNGDIELVAIDNAICALSDNFARRDGRIRALSKVLKYCGALKGVAAEIERQYLQRDPLRIPKPKPVLSEAAIEERIAAGADVWAKRAAEIYRRAGKEG